MDHFAILDFKEPQKLKTQTDAIEVLAPESLKTSSQLDVEKSLALPNEPIRTIHGFKVAFYTSAMLMNSGSLSL